MRTPLLFAAGWLVVGAVPSLSEAAPPRETVPGLVKALRQGEKPEQVRAAREIGSLGTAGKAAVPDLLALLRGKYNYELRTEAAHALAQIGPAAVPSLVGVLKDDDPFTRCEAARALARIGPDAAEAVRPLAEALNDDDALIRATAAYALGEIGSAAREAVAALIGRLSDTDKVRKEVIRALGRMGPAAVPDLVRALKDTPVFVRHGAAYALGLIGPEAGEAVPDLGRLLKDPDAGVRAVAAAALAEIGPEAGAVTDALVAALADKTPEVRAQSQAALARVGAPAVPALLHALLVKKATVRYRVLFVLGQIGPQARKAVNALIDALDDRDPRIVSLAALALGEIGPEARDAIRPLKGLFRSSSAEVRGSAALAVAKIDPGEDHPFQELHRQLKQFHPVGGPSPGLAAQLDKKRQAEIEMFLNYYVWITSFRFGDGLKNTSIALIEHHLTLEAIPAIVRTLNVLSQDAGGVVRVVERVQTERADLNYGRDFYFL